MLMRCIFIRPSRYGDDNGIQRPLTRLSTKTRQQLEKIDSYREYEWKRVYIDTVYAQNRSKTAGEPERSTRNPCGLPGISHIRQWLWPYMGAALPLLIYVHSEFVVFTTGSWYSIDGVPIPIYFDDCSINTRTLKYIGNTVTLCGLKPKSSFW